MMRKGALERKKYRRRKSVVHSLRDLYMFCRTDICTIAKMSKFRREIVVSRTCAYIYIYLLTFEGERKEYASDKSEEPHLSLGVNFWRGQNQNRCPAILPIML